MAFIPPQGNKTVMVDNSNNIVYPVSFPKVVATQATIAGNNFTSVPSVINPANATTTQLPSVASVVNYVADVVEGGSSGLIPAIQSDIQTLGQVKSNRGEFWFNNGSFVCANKWKTNEPFSLIFTLKRPLDVYGGTEAANRKDAIYTCINRSQDRGFTISMDDKFVGFYYHWSASDGSSKYFSRALNVQKYFDDKPHVWACVFTGYSATLQIDGTTISSNVVEDIAEDVNTYPLTFNFPLGRVNVSNVKCFNFDIASADAPYTLADYMDGKDESPLLKLGGEDYSSTSNWTARWSNASIVSTTNTLEVTTTKDENSQNLPIIVPPRSFITGQTIEVSYDSITTSSNLTLVNPQLYIVGTLIPYTTITGNQLSAVVEKTGTGSLEFTIKVSESNIPSGTTFVITGLKIKVNGALLSLDDYSIKVGATQIIPDVSGNNNDATITGSVMGSKDTSIAKMAQLFYQSQQG